MFKKIKSHKCVLTARPRGDEISESPVPHGGEASRREGEQTGDRGAMTRWIEMEKIEQEWT